MDADTDSELDTFRLLQTGIEVYHHSEDAKTSAYCSLGVIFMGLGIAIVHQEPVTKKLSNMSIKTGDDLGADLLIRTHDLPILFGVELAGEFGGIDKVAE